MPPGPPGYRFKAKNDQKDKNTEHINLIIHFPIIPGVGGYIFLYTGSRSTALGGYYVICNFEQCLYYGATAPQASN